MDRSRTPPRNTFSGMNVPGMDRPRLDRPGTPPINSFSGMAYQQPRRRMLQVAPQFVPGQTGQSNLDFIRHEMSMTPSKKSRKTIKKTRSKKSRKGSKKVKKSVSKKGKKSRKGSKKGKKSRKGSKKGKKSSAKKNRLFKAAVVSRS